MKVYEVWRDSPMGFCLMALYTTREEAEKHAADHNSKIKLDWDAAKVSEVTILTEYAGF